VKLYRQGVIGGEPCYLKFTEPSVIELVVAGGTAGKFSAVIGSWAAGGEEVRWLLTRYRNRPRIGRIRRLRRSCQSV